MARYSIIITLCVLSLFTLCSCKRRQNPRVKFSNTTARGTALFPARTRYIDSFMGIPYAEPPVGNLRFRNPVPKVYRDVSFLANRKKPNCVDREDKLSKGTENEDCLYLNVYRPQSLGTRLIPVMIYFQAGDIFKANFDEPEIKPDNLLTKDIVLVTLTYRLGVFSFFSTGDEQAPGNLGLKDQKVALQWVQTNIAAFNGDPNRVTLFGNGAAAESIHYHTLVDHTEGLFHRYILQSGTALGHQSICDSKTRENRATQLADDLECPINSTREMVDCLRKVEVEKLFLASTSRLSELDFALWKTWAVTKEPIGPDAFLTECPLDLFVRNRQRDLPFIAGFTQVELPTALNVVNKEYYEDHGAGVIYIRQFVETISGSPDMMKRVDESIFKGELYIDAIQSTYEERIKDGFYQYWELFKFLLSRFDVFLTEFYYTHPVVKLLERQRQNSISPSYFYYFNFKGRCSMVNLYYPNGISSMATAHGEELLYLFPCDPLHNSNFNRIHQSLGEDDLLILETVLELWTSFAIEGVPRARAVENWPPYDSQGQCLEIGSFEKPTITLKSGPYKGLISFWENTTLQSCE